MEKIDLQDLYEYVIVAFERKLKNNLIIIRFDLPIRSIQSVWLILIEWLLSILLPALFLGLAQSFTGTFIRRKRLTSLFSLSSFLSCRLSVYSERGRMKAVFFPKKYETHTLSLLRFRKAQRYRCGRQKSAQDLAVRCSFFNIPCRIILLRFSMFQD